MTASTIRNLVKAATSFTKVNSPILTTVVGASGVVAVAVLAAKAGARSQEDIRLTKNVQPDHSVPAREIVRMTWRHYVPTAIVASVTVGAIVAGHRVNASRTAAAVAAFSLSERTFDEYRARIVEKLGSNEERVIRDEVRAKEKTREEFTPAMVLGTGDITCLDMYTGRYFTSDKQSIRTAVNDVNHIIWQQMYCSLTEFYDHLGLPKTSNSDNVGWNNDHPLDICYSASLTPDDRPCLVMQFSFNPSPDFATFN